MKNQEKIDYDKIAREQGVEESRRIWMENNTDRMKKIDEWEGDPLICPCCEKYYFKIEDNDEICPVCEWQDDMIQRRDPERTGGANKLSLYQYKLKWETQQVNQTLTQISIKYPDIKEDLDKAKHILSLLALKEAATN